MSYHHKRPKQSQIRQILKKITNALKLLGFKINLKPNLEITNFLGITLNLEKGNSILSKKKMTHLFIYALPQTTNPQLSNRYQYPLAVDYLTTHPISTYITAKRTYTTTY